MNIQETTGNQLNFPNRAAGFSLFELLIAILVLSVGLLGLATLQSQGIKSNYSASMRTEATFLAMDITDRMRANPNGVAGGGYAIDTRVNVPADPGCGDGCTAAQRPAQDAYDWTNAIRTQLGGGQAAGWHAVVAPVGGVFMVTIMWDDERRGVTGTACSGNPDADMTCFQTLFQP